MKTCYNLFSWGQVSNAFMLCVLPIDRLGEWRCLCLYEEELHWPVFRRRIRNYVSLLRDFADHVSLHLFFSWCRIAGSCFIKSIKPKLTSQLCDILLLSLFLTPHFSMKCTESEEEEPIKGKESQLQLSCFINQEVKYLATGLRLVSVSSEGHYATLFLMTHNCGLEDWLSTKAASWEDAFFPTAENNLFLFFSSPHRLAC